MGHVELCIAGAIALYIFVFLVKCTFLSYKANSLFEMLLIFLIICIRRFYSFYDNYFFDIIFRNFYPYAKNCGPCGIDN